MTIEVKFAGREELARFDRGDRYKIEHGVLIVDRTDGTRSIFSPTVWEYIEDDLDDGLHA